jgi:hypothetical protein
MDHAEQLFALQVHLEVNKRIMSTLQEGDLTEAELQQQVLEHTRMILQGADSTARLIQALRNSSD